MTAQFWLEPETQRTPTVGKLIVSCLQKKVLAPFFGTHGQPVGAVLMGQNLGQVEAHRIHHPRNCRPCTAEGRVKLGFGRVKLKQLVASFQDCVMQLQWEEAQI